MIKFDCKHDLHVFSWWMDQNKEILFIFKFWPKLHIFRNHENFLRRNIENCLILKFVFIHCQTVKVIQNDQILLGTEFTHVFLMNGTKLKSFGHFQILTKKAWLELSRNPENWLILKFLFIHCRTVKVSHNDQIRL